MRERWVSGYRAPTRPGRGQRRSRPSFDIRSRVCHRPAQPQEVVFDAQRAPVLRSVLRTLRVGPLPSFTLPTIEDHLDVGIAGERPLQARVDKLITTRNDIEKPWHRPPHSPLAYKWPTQVPPLASLFVPSGQRVCDHATPVTWAPSRLARVRFALARLASFRLASLRLAPCRLALARVAPFSFAPLRLARGRSAPA